MDGGFACPECGSEIRLPGLSPGRHVHCGWCEALVEVPFIPRAEQVRRLRQVRRSGKKRRWPVWANLVVAVLTGAIALAGINRAFRLRRQSAETDALSRLIAASAEEEKAGRLGPALADIEGALSLARKLKTQSPELDEWNRRRSTISRREAEERLKALDAYRPTESDEPSLTVGHGLTLLARARKDEALLGMEERVTDVLERLRLRWVEHDRAAAGKALERGDPERAMKLCVRMHASTEELVDGSRRQLRTEAASLAERIIKTHGVVVEPITGQFTLGSPESYQALINPVLHRELLKHSYLPRTCATPWDGLWTLHSPYRVTMSVLEHQDDYYLSSKNRVSTLDSRLNLDNRGQTLWYFGPTVRSETPLPGLMALQASRIASGEHRNAEFERLLYTNARDGLIDRLGHNLRNLPPCRPDPN